MFSVWKSVESAGFIHKQRELYVLRFKQKVFCSAGPLGAHMLDLPETLFARLHMEQHLRLLLWLIINKKK